MATLELIHCRVFRLGYAHLCWKQALNAFGGIFTICTSYLRQG